METFIILTSAAEHLIIGLKKKLRNFKFVIPEKNREGERLFPDGEVYVKISKVDGLKDGRVIILHSGTPNTNAGLAELELILQILKDHKIKPEVFFTYFPYCRQDKVFECGETNAAENLVKKLINYYRVRKIYIIDPHFYKSRWPQKYPIVNISAVPSLIKKSQKEFGRNILFLSPDNGGKRRTGIAGLDKKRINSFNVNIFSPKIVLRGKTIGVVDDIVGTGGTLLRFYEFVKKSGGGRVAALVTHGVVDAGIKKIKKTFVELYLTNTINRKEANVDITDLIAEVVNRKR